MPEQSDRLAMFIPLQKADAAQRLVYGHFDETPDRANEVCDYATAKPAFEAWSAEMAKASDGKSLGNIRGQHSNIAAGKLTDISFDDDGRRIGFVAHIVDDNEWRKVEEGVYTGFSPGGRYAKRWKDGDHTRYTPLVRELSIVDVPCNPSAGFTMVKADGTEADVPFVLDKAYEPGNEATLARAGELAKAAGTGRKATDFVTVARAELIAEKAGEELAKMAADEPAVETVADPVAALEEKLAKAETVAVAAQVEDKGPFGDLAKVAAAIRLITSEDPRLAKGLYTVGWLAELMDRFASLQSCLSFEADCEGDGSAAPADAAEILKQIGALLVRVTQEEVAEAVSEAGDNADIILIVDGDDMELATSIVDLVKADTDLMAKAGARNSKTDAATIQAMHDGAVQLGATCDGEANKADLAASEAEKDRLAKAVADAGPRVEALAKSIEALQEERIADREKLAATEARLEELSKRAEPPKGHVIVIDKEGDGADLGKGAEADPLAAINAMPPGRAKQEALLRHSAGR